MKSMLKFISKQKGFTLVEILVAVAILSFVIMALSNLLTHSYKGIFLAGQKSTQLYQYQQIIENSIANCNGESPYSLTLQFSGNYEISVSGQIISAGPFTTFISD